MLDATGDNADAYTNALDAMNNSQGSVNEGLEIFAGTSAFAAQRSMNDLKLKMEDLYVNGVGPLITGFGTLPNVLQTAIIGVGVMAVASQFLGGVSLVGLVGSLSAVSWSLLLLRGQLYAVAVSEYLSAGAKLALSAATWIATTATWALNTAMYANPVGVIVLGVLALAAALAVAGYAIYRFRDEIMGGLQQAWDWIKENWVKLLPALLGGPFGIAASAVWIFWDEITALVDQVLGWVRDNWVKLLPAALLFPFIGLPVLIAAPLGHHNGWVPRLR